MNERHTPTPKLKEMVWMGDTLAYDDLYTVYLDEPSEEFLFWAMLMANKYDYPKAYYDVYYALKNAFNPATDPHELNNIDSTSKKMALYYLKIAADKDYHDARETLEQILKKDSAARRYVEHPNFHSRASLLNRDSPASCWTKR